MRGGRLPNPYETKEQATMWGFFLFFFPLLSHLILLMYLPKFQISDSFIEASTLERHASATENKKKVMGPTLAGFT